MSQLYIQLHNLLNDIQKQQNIIEIETFKGIPVCYKCNCEDENEVCDGKE